MRLIIERLIFAAVALWMISTAIFVAVQLLPGDLAEAILGQNATPEIVAAFRQDLGLDRPAFARYLAWVGEIMRGDLGRSLSTGGQISDLIGFRLRNTMLLASVAAVLAVPLSLMLGILAALYPRSLFDRAINFAALVPISLPSFLVAYILVLFLAIKLHLFPGISSMNAGTGLGDQIYRCILPAATLALGIMAHIMRTTRAALSALCDAPYVEMAGYKGLSPGRIMLVHMLPNALPPIINVIVFNLAYLVVGVVVVEVVFAYPGLGQLMVDSVTKRDIPVVQACALVFATTYLALNTLADILSLISNPRLLHAR